MTGGESDKYESICNKLSYFRIQKKFMFVTDFLSVYIAIFVCLLGHNPNKDEDTRQCRNKKKKNGP